MTNELGHGPDGRLILERIKVGVQELISPEVMAGMNVSVQASDFLADQLVARLKLNLLAGTLVNERQTHHFEVPATWWQHWKHDHQGSWYARRFVAWRGIRYTATGITAHYRQNAALPQARLPLQDKRLGYPVIFENLSAVEPFGQFSESHHTEPGERVRFMSERELASRLMYSEAVQAVHLAIASRGGNLLISTHDLYMIVEHVLRALKEMGVNPSQLVQEQP
jgi:hypothetical protein